MFDRIMPKETSFFNFFEQHSRLAIDACKELNEIASNPAELVMRANRIKEIEHEADDITHKCIDALHRTFITPVDRGDIHRLMKRLDDIIDSVDAAASRIMLYEITDMRPELKQFTDVLMKATAGIDGAIHNLRKMKKKDVAIQDCCGAVYDAEHQGDQILRLALARLFKETNEPFLVIKWKEIFERLEIATDRCEEAANIIEGIVIEAS